MSGGPPFNHYGFTTGPRYPVGSSSGLHPQRYPASNATPFVHPTSHIPLATTTSHYYPSGEMHFTSYPSQLYSQNLTHGPRWIQWQKNYMLPANAVEAGYDIDGSKIYVGRLQHKGDLLPAKVIPQKRIAYVSYGGIEIHYSSCEILCHEHSNWIRCSHGNVPPGAIVVGRTSSGENLYAGRVHYMGSLTVGKVHPSHKVCYIPFDGKEIPHVEYDVLVAY